MGRVDTAMHRATGAVIEDGAVAVATETPLPAARQPELARTGTLLESIDSNLVQKVVVDRHMMPASREQYRKLAASLHQAQAATGLRVVMIGSAVAGEGKTLTASNLALTLSESYQRRVLLIDADFRRPSLHTVFKLAGEPGLMEGLRAQDLQKMPLHQVSAHLMVLPAGKASSDPMAGLVSPRMKHMIDEARETFDWVIIDTPPVGLLTDASLLAAMADGVVMVVKADATPYDLVKRALETIGQDRVLGIVLNRASARAHRYGYGYAGYAHYHASAPQSGGAD